MYAATPGGGSLESSDISRIMRALDAGDIWLMVAMVEIESDFQ